MPDTPENQLEYPHGNKYRGVGFPLMRAVAIVSLATGAVLDIDFAKYSGKGTGEISIFGRMGERLPAGSIMVADRYYPTFATVATLMDRGVDMVSISHAGRLVDFSAGKMLGPSDHIVEWRPAGRKMVCSFARDGHGSRIGNRR